MNTQPRRPRVHGLLAEFDTPEELMTAAKYAHDAGYQNLDAYSPFPIEGLSEAIGFRRTWLPWLVLIGGIIGCVGGYFLQYWTAVIDYPMNIGGRPLHSWPSFIVVTFETTILFASVAAVFGMLAMNGLPMPYHPVFNVPSFASATRDKFFLCIESTDPKFDREDTRQFLERTHPRQVSEVEP